MFPRSCLWSVAALLPADGRVYNFGGLAAHKCTHTHKHTRITHARVRAQCRWPSRSTCSFSSFFANRIHATPFFCQIFHLLLYLPFYSASSSPYSSFPLPASLFLRSRLRAQSAPPLLRKSDLKDLLLPFLSREICFVSAAAGAAPALRACLRLAFFGLRMKRFCVLSLSSSSPSHFSCSYCSLYSILRSLHLLLPLSSSFLPLPPCFTSSSQKRDHVALFMSSTCWCLCLCLCWGREGGCAR